MEGSCICYFIPESDFDSGIPQDSLEGLDDVSCRGLRAEVCHTHGKEVKFTGDVDSVLDEGLPQLEVVPDALVGKTELVHQDILLCDGETEVTECSTVIACEFVGFQVWIAELGLLDGEELYGRDSGSSLCPLSRFQRGILERVRAAAVKFGFGWVYDVFDKVSWFTFVFFFVFFFDFFFIFTKLVN